MPAKKYEFSIIFKELKRLEEEADMELISDEVAECEEVRNLREIILEVQTPAETYLTTT